MRTVLDLALARRRRLVTLRSVVVSLLSGLLALGGVVVGVALEPVRAAAARRAQSRMERTERCARLILTATSSRSLLLALNLANRRRAAGQSVNDIDGDEIIRQYRAARAELRQTVALFHLWGPPKLIDAAEAVLRADRALRSTRFVIGEVGGEVAEDHSPAEVWHAAAALEAEIRRFAGVARNHVG